MRDGRQPCSANPTVLSEHAKTVEASGGARTVLAVNAGSSSIRVAVYSGGQPLRRLLSGKVDRVGLSGTNLTSTDSAGQSLPSHTVDPAEYRSSVAFLLDWLESQPEFTSVQAVGHRTVHGMTHNEPKRVTSELLDDLRRITP